VLTRVATHRYFVTPFNLGTRLSSFKLIDLKSNQIYTSAVSSEGYPHHDWNYSKQSPLHGLIHAAVRSCMHLFSTVHLFYLTLACQRTRCSCSDRTWLSIVGFGELLLFQLFIESAWNTQWCGYHACVPVYSPMP